MMKTSESRLESYVILIAATFCFAWGTVAWIEWFFIKEFYPSDGSPVPHLQFAFQAVVLLLGCVVATIAVPLIAVISRRWLVIFCAVPPATFVFYQFWRFCHDFF